LCYDKSNNRLLIACKGKAGKGKEYKHKKAIYAYNLTTKELEKTPVYIIAIESVRNEKGIGKTQRAYEKVVGTLKDENITINPSGIAIHPLTGDVFIVSAVGNTLLVLSNKGEIKYAAHLSKRGFKQPEGITFDNNGTLYIANEGQKGKANIKVFSYQPKR